MAAAGGFVWQCKIRAPNHPRNKQACAPSQVDDKHSTNTPLPLRGLSRPSLEEQDQRPRPERQPLVWFGLHDMSVPIEGHGWADGTHGSGKGTRPTFHPAAQKGKGR